MIKVHQHALINQMLYQKKQKTNLGPVCRWPLGVTLRKKKII